MCDISRHWRFAALKKGARRIFITLCRALSFYNQNKGFVRPTYTNHVLHLLTIPRRQVWRMRWPIWGDLGLDHMEPVTKRAEERQVWPHPALQCQPRHLRSTRVQVGTPHICHVTSPVCVFVICVSVWSLPYLGLFVLVNIWHANSPGTKWTWSAMI